MPVLHMLTNGYCKICAGTKVYKRVQAQLFSSVFGAFAMMQASRCAFQHTCSSAVIRFHDRQM